MSDRPYFGSDNLTLVDVVAVTIIFMLSFRGGISLNKYPKISAWCSSLIARPAWQNSEATEEAFAEFRFNMLARMQRN
ncbi:MAG: glutathione binding-like protein [Trichodesmium sp. St16_bin4-tuft]|nr:glutathione binding-like protein [Trichodesmium sp. St5_bin8]MDE5076839.1 glutathione binding-like protein [Trichodesmium sp. St2_bin6]MDE5092072.1 glutathione binding-like protein [Trichodesmium sp. St18_bin3_1_1]MDE5095063.1 glutathione binding-like protein [Trichodesmium sp. St11_bin5]MDE5100878.1 glutathione binding-like protein [Trichodesmium sp. St16_bin4-tuft]MDE5102618.1 glutathione binding-like protein [Trichodesmium sp. St19_bin2]